MKFIDDAKSAWKFFSVWALVLSGSVPALWASLPDEIKLQIPTDWMSGITAFIAFLGVIGRMIKQN